MRKIGIKSFSVELTGEAVWSWTFVLGNIFFFCSNLFTSIWSISDFLFPHDSVLNDYMTVSINFFSPRLSNLFVYSCSPKPLIILRTSVVSVALSPFFPLILFIRVFSLFKMNQFINFVYHFKEQFY